MSAEQVALEHYRARRRLSAAVAGLARELWSRLAPDDLDSSWSRILPQLLIGLTGAQLGAARRADVYVDQVLVQQDVDPAAVARVVPEALAGVASDGRPLDSLLLNPLTVVKAGIAGGATIQQSLAAGYANLDMIVRTQLADAGRGADQIAITTHPAATGYVRMLVGESCSRCVVLAGRRYEWNAGFRRHPRCDCIHVPAAEDAAGDIMTNPQAYFDSLTVAEQDKAFTAAGAEAIREGADIGRVVNARRGMQTATIGGRSVLVTTEAAGRRPRLMPEAIISASGGDREQAVRLLKLHGYIR